MSKLREALADLVRANVDSDTGDLARDFRRYRVDVEHGCETGVVSGLIYYHETCAFYDAHEDEILDVLEEYGHDFGSEPYDLVSLRNARAWFAADCLLPGVCDELAEADEADEADGLCAS